MSGENNTMTVAPTATATTTAAAAGIQFTPSVYEIAAMGAGGLALLFTVCIFCLLCMILCLVIRVKRAVRASGASGLRTQANVSSGEYNEVRVELNRRTKLVPDMNHTYATSSKTQVTSSQQGATASISPNPLMIQPVGEEEEEEEERMAIEENQRQNAIKAILQKTPSKKPPVRPKPKSNASLSDLKTAQPRKQSLGQGVTTATSSHPNTTTASDTEEPEDAYDDVVTSLESYARATQYHSQPQSAPLIPTMGEESEDDQDTYEEMTDQKKPSATPLTNCIVEDDSELYETPDSVPVVAGYTVTHANQTVEDEDVYL